MKERILITGAAGFVAHQLIDYFLNNSGFEIIAMDGLTYAGSLDRIINLESYQQNKDRVKFVYWNLRSAFNEYISEKIGQVDYILHLAANSSVEQTIKYPVESVYDNVLATVNVLEFARTQKNLKLMNMFSTDEVYGPFPEGINATEESPHKPSNPYSAGKAGAEDYAHAYFTTYKVPVFTTNTMNVFGFSQNKEKYIPTVIRCVETGETLPVYSNKEKTKAGSRFWIFVYDVADAILFLLKNGNAGERYNVVGEEWDNLELAKEIARILGKELKYEMFDFHSSRPGHDLRYGMDGTKMQEMGWTLKYGVSKALKEVIKSYVKEDKNN